MTARRSRENVRNAQGMYVDGNTVRRLQEVPERNIPAVRGTQDRQVNSSVDLNRIKKRAIGRLGMNYPREDQKKTYSMSNNSYVRQYQDVPDK